MVLSKVSKCNKYTYSKGRQNTRLLPFVLICLTCRPLEFSNTKKMRILEPLRPVIWRQGEGFMGLCEHVAKCAAICYNSQPKEGGAAVDFVKSLIKRGHGRPLEFGTINGTASIGSKMGEPLLNLFGFSCYGRVKKDEEAGLHKATFNLRQAVEVGIPLEVIEKVYLDSEQTANDDFFPRITIYYPSISRAIADEFRTHTSLSTLMQSTRYVNAAKWSDKTPKDMDFIMPCWFDKADEGIKAEARELLEMVEKFYTGAIQKGLKPQEARDLLPLGIQTRMVQCGFLDSWENFLRLRTAKDAHPDARRTAKAVYAAIINERTELKFKLDDDAK